MAMLDEERKAKTRLRVEKWRANNPEAAKNYRDANKDRALVASMAWAKANPERVCEIGRKADAQQKRKDRRKHMTPEQKAARAAIGLAYRARNQEKVAARARAYKVANRDKINVHKQNRRAKVIGTGGKLSHGIRQKLMALQRGKCAGCAAKLKTTGSHLDHIMPLALGGAHADENIQLLCPPCNLGKNATHPVDWAQKQGRLL